MKRKNEKIMQLLGVPARLHVATPQLQRLGGSSLSSSLGLLALFVCLLKVQFQLSSAFLFTSLGLFLYSLTIFLLLFLEKIVWHKIILCK